VREPQPVGLAWGWGQPGEGVAAQERACSSLLPSSLSFSLPPAAREAGVRGNWMLPSANADAPTSLSSLLLLGLHGIGGSTDESTTGGGGRREGEQRRVTPRPSPFLPP
jgi:hypothetical protein